MVRILPALSEADIAQARILFREYGSIRDVIPCVGGFDSEIAALPGSYAPPDGRLLLALDVREQDPGEAAGCAALRRFDKDTCEMKRLYVRPNLRGHGAGRMLVEELIAEARLIGYERMVLDTLPGMTEAHGLYRNLGFREIPGYWKNPIPGVLYFELPLRST
jgi:putative acetyltransferase